MANKHLFQTPLAKERFSQGLDWCTGSVWTNWLADKPVLPFKFVCMSEYVLGVISPCS